MALVLATASVFAYVAQLTWGPIINELFNNASCAQCGNLTTLPPTPHSALPVAYVAYALGAAVLIIEASTMAIGCFGTSPGDAGEVCFVLMIDMLLSIAMFGIADSSLRSPELAHHISLLSAYLVANIALFLSMFLIIYWLDSRSKRTHSAPGP